MAAELSDNATGQAPEQALANAGYCSEKNFEDLAESSTELVVAMGREGKRCLELDAQTHPHTGAMVAKLHTHDGKAAYRRRKWLRGAYMAHPHLIHLCERNDARFA